MAHRRYTSRDLLQTAMKCELRKAGVEKRVICYTLRLSFVTHFLELG